MTVEIVTILILLGTGSVLTRAGGFRGVAVPSLGFLVGVGIAQGALLLQVVLHLPTSPLLTWALVGVVGGGGLVWALRGAQSLRVSPWAAGGVLALVLALVVFFRGARFFRWHTDSLEYLFQTRMLADGSYRTGAWNGFFEARPLGVPALHASAALQGEYYLRSITPILALAFMVAFSTLLARSLRDKGTPSRLVLILVGLGIGLLLSTNRFVYHFTYLNGHLLEAAMVLVVAVCLWRLAGGEAVAREGHILVIFAVIPPLILARVEGALVLALILVPALVSPALSPLLRRLFLGWSGAVAVLWYGFGLVNAFRQEFDLSPSILANFLLGAVAVLIACVWRTPRRLPPRPTLVRWVEGGAWRVVMPILVVIDPEVFLRNAYFTYQNQFGGSGLWGPSLVLIGALVVLAVALTSFPGAPFLRLPVTTFVPMAFLLAAARGGGYREGMFDSLNRMWAQVLPLAVYFLIISVALGTVRPWVGRVRARFAARRRAAGLMRGFLRALGGWRDPRPLLAVMLIFGVAVNAAFFPIVERTTPPSRAKAFDRSDSGDIRVLALTNPTSRSRWDMYMAMAALGPESTLTIASDLDEDFDHHRFYAMSMGEARQVVPGTLDSASLWARVSVGRTVIAKGEGGYGNPPWEVLLAEPDQQHADLVAPVDFVKWTLQGGTPASMRVGRHWALLRFADDNHPWGYRVMLIDASLIGVEG